MLSLNQILTTNLMITLAHLSDLHFGRERPEVVAGLFASLIEQQPEAVIISGDLTQRAKQSEYAAAEQFLSEIKTTRLIVPGNHDISAFNLLERFLCPWVKWQKIFGEPLESELDNPEVLLLGINTTRKWASFLDWSRGRISNEQINNILSRFQEEPPDKLRLLVTHHPFWLPTDQHHRGLIGNRDLALTSLGNGSLDMIISGHVHMAYNQVQKGIIISHAGSSTSNRLLPGHSNSYKIIRGERSSLNIYLFVWEGKKFSCKNVDKFIRQADGWVYARPKNTTANKR